MKILILGGDGYLGWSSALKFAKDGHKVTVVDNYARRTLAKETDSASLLVSPSYGQVKLAEDILNVQINARILDLAQPQNMYSVVKEVKPDTVVHFAEQPSAPYLGDLTKHSIH